MSMCRRSLGTVVLCLSGILEMTGASAQSGPGEVGWTPGLFGMNGVSGHIGAAVIFDDGTGPALYVAGGFGVAGTIASHAIARWDGSTWSSLGSSVFRRSNGSGGFISDLAIFDDGNGPALYATGSFATVDDVEVNNIARWDGTTWRALEYGLPSQARALGVYDDGITSWLFVAGDFSEVQNDEGWYKANGVARWDGARWSGLEMGNRNGVEGAMIRSFLSTVDDVGPALYIGGDFEEIAGVSASGLARFDKESLEEVGGGVEGTVTSMCVADHGDGPLLYVGGVHEAGGMVAGGIAAWNGSSWTAPEDGIEQGSVSTLLAFGEPGEQELWAGGQFDAAGVIEQPNLAIWSGSEWRSPTVTPPQPVWALAEFDEGNGPTLFVGGTFEHVGNLVASAIARLRGDEWSRVGPDQQGVSAGLGPFSSPAVADLGDGEKLYTSGVFDVAGTVISHALAAWDGESWSPIEHDLRYPANAFSHPLFNALLPLEDGIGGTKLVLGGHFESLDLDIKYIIAYDGESFTPLGDGLNHTVHDLALFDDGTGNGAELYATGTFSFSGQKAVGRIARWDGTSWNYVYDIGHAGYSLTVDDDGSGEALYVGGNLANDNGVVADRVGRWDGQTWTILGDRAFNGKVRHLEMHDDGSGTTLYACGEFTQLDDGTVLNHIARWTGEDWVAVGSGFNDNCIVLLAHDDGSGAGTRLFAGGWFRKSGNDSQSLSSIAVWDGIAWQQMSAGLSIVGSNIGFVGGLAVFDDGRGPTLYAGGAFDGSGDIVSVGIARWGKPLRGPGVPAMLTGCDVTMGSTDNPPCEVDNLLEDDDVDQILRSQFGFSAFERNLTEIVIHGNGADATTMVSIDTRDGSDTTNVVAKVKAWNYATNAIVDIAQYDVSFPSDDTAHSTPVNSTDFIKFNGDVEVRLRYVAPATFMPLGFTVGLDQVQVMVE